MLPDQDQRIGQHVQRYRQLAPFRAHHELVLLKLIAAMMKRAHHHSFAAVSISTPLSAAGAFQRSTGFLAAVVSSSREMRVECGALLTSSGFSSTSRATCRIASTNKSSSSRDSLSVGSIINAPGTISGNDTVYG